MKQYVFEGTDLVKRLMALHEALVQEIRQGTYSSDPFSDLHAWNTFSSSFRYITPYRFQLFLSQLYWLMELEFTSEQECNFNNEELGELQHKLNVFQKLAEIFDQQQHEEFILADDLSLFITKYIKKLRLEAAIQPIHNLASMVNERLHTLSEMDGSAFNP